MFEFLLQFSLHNLKSSTLVEYLFLTKLCKICYLHFLSIMLHNPTTGACIVNYLLQQI